MAIKVFSARTMDIDGLFKEGYRTINPDEYLGARRRLMYG